MNSSTRRTVERLAIHRSSACWLMRQKFQRLKKIHIWSLVSGQVRPRSLADHLPGSLPYAFSERRQTEEQSRRGDSPNQALFAASDAGMAGMRWPTVVCGAGIRRRAADDAPERIGRFQKVAAPSGYLSAMLPAARSGHCAGLGSWTGPGSGEEGFGA